MIGPMPQQAEALSAAVNGLPIGYAAFSRRDFDQALIGLDPEIEFIVPPYLVAEQHVFHGHEGVRRFWELGFREFEWWTIEADELVPIPPDKVLVHATETMCSRGSRAEATVHTFHLWTFRNALATRCQVFFDRDAAMRAAGLMQE
jgi:ketosteroid isomerase-like protein